VGRGAARDVRGPDGGDAEASLSLVDERAVGCYGSISKKEEERGRDFFKEASSPITSKLKKL
jgi:hypothetical protein